MTEDEVAALSYIMGKGDGNLDPSDSDNWSDDMVQEYADNLRNFLYTYKESAKQVDSSIDPNEYHRGPMAQDIEKSRNEVLQKYGTIDGETHNYTFANEDIDKVNSDITDLFSLEQEVKIHVIPMEWVENMELTAKQVAAFSFMIEEETEEE